MGLRSLNMTLQHHLDSAMPPISQKSTPNFRGYQYKSAPTCPSTTYQGAKMYPHKSAPTCPSTAYQGAKTLCIYIVWMWDAVYRALKPQPWLFTTSLGLKNTPNFPKIHTHLQRHISIRVYPHAHPQHIKVLKSKKIFIMDVGCSLWGFKTSTMTLKHHLDSHIPPISQKFTHTFRGVSA
jgi:hypothetical protein